MDWAAAVECHRKPLLKIVVGLYTMIGIAEGGSIMRLKWPLYRAVLALLRPAEAAVRRLIIVAAQGLKVKARTRRAAPKGTVISRKGKGKTRQLFRLFDPQVDRHGGFRRRRHPVPASPRAEPRIHFFDLYSDIPPWLRPAPSPPQPQPEPKPEPSDTVSAGPLCRRLAAILDALKDIPRQARRYARWRDKPSEERRPQRETPLRRGAPPYLREDSSEEVHRILKECHWLVRTLPADTS